MIYVPCIISFSFTSMLGERYSKILITRSVSTV